MTVTIAPGLLESPQLFESCKKMGSTFALITDTHTEGLFGKALLQRMHKEGLSAHLFAFPPGENYKTRATKEALENKMLAQGMGRDCCVIALGGGIVTDVAGFLASTYCRGVPCILIPTSLLAMVDASIGGKTGVNVPEGKNLIGSLYPPKAIFIDVSTLKTLPEKELKNGLVECLKHGLILDASYFSFLEKNREKILLKDLTILEKVIADSCMIKTSVVAKDPSEKGLRRLLNFGHTIGHAIETLTHHEIPHGYAVALGILAESHLSIQLGHLPAASLNRIQTTFQAFAIPTQLTIPLTPEDFKRAMQLDKKSLKKVPRFVLIKEIGECLECNGNYCESVPETVLNETLEWLTAGGK